MNQDFWIECIDDDGRKVLLPFQDHLCLAQQRAAAADAVLGIQREQIPVQYLDLPEHANTYPFMRLAHQIETVARNFPFKLDTDAERIWMRCLQHFWHAKGIALAQRIHPLPIKDPLAVGGFIRNHLLPKAAADNLELGVTADESWYRLLLVGEPYVKQWAQQQEIEYPFETAEALFLETLRVGFEICLTEGVLCPCSPDRTRKQHRDQYRCWLKFLNDHFDGEPEGTEYERLLRSMQWKGYALLVLRQLKSVKPTGKLWRQYVKGQRPLIKYLDSAIDWNNGAASQADQDSAGRRTRRSMPIEAEITPDGYFQWRRSPQNES